MPADVIVAIVIVFLLTTTRMYTSVIKGLNRASCVLFEVNLLSCISHIMCLSSMMLNITYCKFVNCLLKLGILPHF